MSNVTLHALCFFSLSAFWNVASQVNPERHILEDVNDFFSINTYLINSVEPSIPLPHPFRLYMIEKESSIKSVI